jgi:signal transduction histidine kinase
MSSDGEIAHNVEEALKWDLDIEANSITIAVKDGVVTLTGFVASSLLRSRAGQAAKRAAGVQAVANDIEVRPPGTVAKPDSELVDELRKSVQRKDQFLAQLAHEMRNPLVPIANALQMLVLKPADPQVVNDARGLIARQLSQMTRLVNDLFDHARCAHGTLEICREKLDLADVVAAAVETVQPMILARQHQLTAVSTPGAVIVDGDCGRLTQVVVNLLNNAAKFTNDGGNIWLVAEVDKDWAFIKVRDTGVGISKEMLAHVFDVYVQGEQRPVGSGGGLGLGLTLARQLVELHGGTLSAHSEGPGRGSEFVVRLPVARTVTQSAQNTECSLKPSGASRERTDYPQINLPPRWPPQLLGAACLSQNGLRARRLASS